MKNLILCAILVVAAALRVAGARGEFWLDEAWSALIARGLENPYVDNNHLLNTAFMWLVRPVWHWQIYRIPSVVLGVGCVYLAWKIVRRRSEQPLAALVAAFVVAISYPLTVYSSEARGYAPAIFFSLLCFELLSDAQAGRKRLPIAYWICCVLGMLCHLTFLQFFCAAIVYTFVITRRSLAEMAILHGIPAVGAGIYYFLFVRHIHIAGGPASSAWKVVFDTAALFIGRDGVISGAIFFGLLAILLARLGRRRDPLLGFVIAILVAPFAILAVKTFLLGHAEILYVRYFLIPSTFVLILSMGEIVEWATESRVMTCAAAGVLVYFIAANVSQLVPFLRIGRGEPLSVFRFIVDDRKNETIWVWTLWPGEAGQHDIRASRLLNFYEPYLPKKPKLVLVKPPEWLLVSATTGEAPPAIEFAGGTYSLQKVFRQYGLSGWTWCAYQRTEMIR